MAEDSRERIDIIVDNLKAQSRGDRFDQLKDEGLSPTEALEKTKTEIENRHFGNWKFRDIIDRLRPRTNNN